MKKFSVSCLGWVPRGVSKQHPADYELSNEEMEQLTKQQGEMSLDEMETAGDNSAETKKSAKDSKKGSKKGGAMDMGDDSKDVKDAPTKGGKKSSGKSSGKNAKMSGTGSDEENDEEGDGDAIDKEFDLDNYDDEDEPTANGASLFLAGKNLTVYEDNNQDPHITLHEAADSSDEEDEDATQIMASDSVLLVGATNEEDKQSRVEVYVFDEAKSAHYIHHDFNLPAFPLSFAWLGVDPRGPTEENKSASGSFLAVGTFEPGIEIWNLDVLNPVEPVTILGGRPKQLSAMSRKAEKEEEGGGSQYVKGSGDTKDDVSSSSKKGGKAANSKKKKKKILTLAEAEDEALGKLKPESHTGPVMALCVHNDNKIHMASGSADSTVKLWDITTQKCLGTLNHHKAEVQGVDWMGDVMLTGSYDKTVAVLDMKSQKRAFSFDLKSSVESLQWAPGGQIFMVSTESGRVIAGDVRQPNKPLFTLDAHNKAATTVQFCQALPRVFATGSLDGSVKIWEVTSNGPSLVCTRDMKKELDQIMCMKFDPTSPFVLAIGGTKGREFAIWDIMENQEMAHRFGKFDTRPTNAPPSKGKKESKKNKDDDDDDD